MTNEGLPVVVRKIKILEHLTDQQASKIKSVHVYEVSTVSDLQFIAFHISALYTTTEDEVYVAGRDSLVGGWSWLAPMLEESRLIPELSGKSVVKVVVRDHFGAALTAGHDLYLWGRDVGRVSEEVPAGLTRQALEDHHSGAGQCAKCSLRLVPRRRGVVSWSVCPTCKSYHNRVSTLPPPTSWVGRPRTLLGYKTDAAPPRLGRSFCVRCGDLKECEVEEVSSFKIVCCRSCRHPFDGNPPKIPPQTNSNIHKVTFPSPITILDIIAGFDFLLLQTSEELVIWGALDGLRYNHAVLNPDNVVFAKVACGGDHVAVITDKGELYTCGAGSEGQLGYYWSRDSDGYMTLRKVELAAPAVDVTCGLSSTVCLLQDGTHVVYGDRDTKVLNVGALSLNTSKPLFCVPYYAPQEYKESVVSATEQLVRTRNERSVVMPGIDSNTFILLQNSETENPKGETESAPLTPHLSDLFRNSLLSDFTLKLADGDFIGHRSVLFASSNYFRQLLTHSGSLSVLDVSTYNPTAYNCLLQYFYGVPRTDMTVPDMMDLYALATSYKENWIAADVLSKLKNSINSINSINVLLLLDKAKETNATELIKECQSFLSAPDFQKSLFQDAPQDHDILFEILRIKRRKTQEDSSSKVAKKRLK